MPGGDERHGDGLGQPEAREHQEAAGHVSTYDVLGPEDGMRRAPADYPDEATPARYRAIANDPEACQAMAAEVLDHAFDKLGDGRDIRDLATLANVWLRLSELAAKAAK